MIREISEMYRILCPSSPEGKGAHMWSTLQVDGGTRYTCSLCGMFIVRNLDVRTAVPPPIFPASPMRKYVLQIKSGCDEYGRDGFGCTPADTKLILLDAETGHAVGELVGVESLTLKLDAKTGKSTLELSLAEPGLSIYGAPFTIGSCEKTLYLTAIKPQDCVPEPQNVQLQ